MKRFLFLGLALLLCAEPAAAQTTISGLPSATQPLTGNELTILMQNGKTVNAPVNTLESAIYPITVNKGGTSSTTAAGARANLGAAANGNNADITALSGLTTPLPISEGGCGQITAAACLSALGGAPSASPTLTGTVTFPDGTTWTASTITPSTALNALFAAPPAIGGTSAAAGHFTTLAASSTVSGTGFSTYLASPPAIGATAPNVVTLTKIHGDGNGAIPNNFNGVPWVFSNNTSSAIPNVGAQFSVYNQDGTTQGINVVGFGNGSGATAKMALYSSDGTMAAPTNLKFGGPLGRYSFGGYDGSTWATDQAVFNVYAGSDWTGSSRETAVQFDVTPSGSTTLGVAMNLSSAGLNIVGGLNMGATANEGAGTVNATGYYVSGTAGLASKSCAFTTTNVATGITLTITGGLITGTTTC